MKGPIAYALGSPNRVAKATSSVDWTAPHSWDFSPIDGNKYPALGLARRAGELGGGVPAVFNAANEVAVEAFIKEELGFTSIVEIVEQTLAKLAHYSTSQLRDISDVTAIEDDARTVARSLILEHR